MTKNNLFSVKDLAEAVLHTANTREAMFNEEAYLCETESQKRRWIENHGDQEYRYGLFADPSRFYHWSIEEAAEHSLGYLKMDVMLARLIDLALYGWWNDTILWAERILGMHEM